MSDLSEYLFGSSPAVVRYQLLEVSHPNFTQTYRLTRNATKGVSVMHEGGGGPFTYEHRPMRIKVNGSSSDLDQSISVTLGDLGEVLPTELAAVKEANGMQTKPTCIYREYRSDDRATPFDPITAPLFPPYTMQIDSITFNRQGCSFRGTPPAFNKTRTGDNYTRNRLPMLRGFE